MRLLFRMTSSRFLFGIIVAGAIWCKVFSGYNSLTLLTFINNILKKIALLLLSLLIIKKGETMKNKKIWIFVLLMSVSSFTFAQRFAYVDSEYILSHIPEYTAALKQLDELSTKWQSEVDAQYTEIEEMYQAYQEDQANMSEQMRRRREDMIVEKEKETRELQRSRFGFEGDLFKERERLLQPIEARLEKAIQVIAERQELDLILDKGSESFLYSNSKMDRSNDVIKQLGYQPK